MFTTYLELNPKSAEIVRTRHEQAHPVSMQGGSSALRSTYFYEKPLRDRSRFVLE